MGVVRIGEIGDRAREGQAVGMYGAGFQRDLWQGKEPEVGQEEWKTRS
jgi:hypothetical protein